MKFFEEIGRYVLLMGSMFTKPEKLSMYWKETMRQIYDIGVGSLGIIAIVSTFVGGITATQFTYQLEDIPFIPMWWMGLIVRESMVLEMAPTITALLIAGKVGSNMASELGTMRISEQIDALEIMGVSTPAYLIGPKIIASIFVMPILIIIALALGIVGGWLAGLAGGFFSTMEYKRGLQDGVENYELIIMLLKAVVFGFLISSVSCFHGFYVRGGALEIGAASTRAVVQSSIMIIVANFLIAFLFL